MWVLGVLGREGRQQAFLHAQCLKNRCDSYTRLPEGKALRNWGLMRTLGQGPTSFLSRAEDVLVSIKSEAAGLVWDSCARASHPCAERGLGLSLMDVVVLKFFFFYILFIYF